MLAFDFGEKRIGVAVGDLDLGVAHPLTTLHGEEGRKRFDAIERLINEWQPVLLVVGMPFHADGSVHDLGRLCRRFAHRLETRFKIPTEMVDERFSSCAAATSLDEAGVKGRRQKAMLDQVAAQHILQAFFDERRHAAA